MSMNMIQYKQITFAEALQMIANDDIENLYLETTDGKIDAAKKYPLAVNELQNKTFFRKEAAI